MMCSPKTMLKFGAAIAIFFALSFIFFPQLRVGIVGLAPFALFALCPLMMIFGMKGMTDKKGDSCSECKHNHTKEKDEKNA